MHLVGHCFGANLALGVVLSGEHVADSIVMLTPGLYVPPTYSAWDKLRVVSRPCLRRRPFRVPQDDALFSRDPDVLAWIGRDRWAREASPRGRCSRSTACWPSSAAAFRR